MCFLGLLFILPAPTPTFKCSKKNQSNGKSVVFEK